MRNDWFACTNWDEISRGCCPHNIVPPSPLDLRGCADSFDASTPSLDWSELNALSDDSTMEDGDSTFVRESNKDRIKAVEVVNAMAGHIQDFTWTIEGFEHLRASGAAETDRLDGASHSFATPSRPASNHLNTAIPRTILRTTSKNPSASRPISDHRALKVMMTCVKVSAKKRFDLLSSGRRVNVVTGLAASGSDSSVGKTFREKLMEAQREFQNESSRSSAEIGVQVTTLAVGKGHPELSALFLRYTALCRNLDVSPLCPQEVLVGIGTDISELISAAFRGGTSRFGGYLRTNAWVDAFPPG